MSLSNGYHAQVAVAYVRGVAIKAQSHGGLIVSPDSEINDHPLALPPELSAPPLEALPPEAIETILSLGRAAGLKLYHFKKSHGELPGSNTCWASCTRWILKLCWTWAADAVRSYGQ